MVDSFAKYFWLFFTEPAKFTSDWLTNSDNIREFLFPIALLPITFIIIINFSSLFSFIFYRRISQVYGLHFIGYFPFLALFSDKKISESLIFGHTISVFSVLLSLSFILFVILFYLVIQNIPRLRFIIYEFNFNFQENGCILNFNCSLIGLIMIFYSLLIIKNIIIAMSLFFGFYWWLIILISTFYSTLLSLFALLILRFFSR